MNVVYALALTGLLSVAPALPSDAREWRPWCGPPAASDGDSPPSLGWHFYCDRDDEDPEADAPTVEVPPPVQPEGPMERIREMRRALEEARAKAVLDPSAENVAAYLHLQQETLERAATFSDAFRRTVWGNPDLDYTLRRPVGALAKRL